MRILFVLTYYRPHVSGLTIYVERLARELARRGHTVTVLTSQYDRQLPREEIMEGVRVVRAPVLLRISKGVIMPTFGWLATKLVLQHEVLCLHLPQLDAAGVALRGGLLRKPVTLTYHCDLSLPLGVFSGVVNRVVDLANLVAGYAAHSVVAYTQDFAAHSPFLQRYIGKVRVIPPPVEMACAGSEQVRAMAERLELDGGPVIGFVARLATEKGVEVLLRALPRVVQAYPRVRVFFAGQYRNVLGEEAYAQRLEPLLKEHAARWRFLGVLTPQELAAFYPNCSLIVLPSLNATESFGLVQVEAMLCGTPSIASDLPGVRQPVLQTGMGRVVPIGDADSLAEAILEVLGNRPAYVRPRAEIEARFSTARTADGYEALFAELLQRLGKGSCRA